MPGTAWSEEMPSWYHFSTLPLAVEHIEDGSQAVHPPLSDAPSAPSLQDFASHSTLHGIKHIFCHGWYTVRHLLWTMAFLGSLAFLIHVYAERVDYYFRYPHATTVEEENRHVMTFPAVTICNLNRLRFSQLSGHDLYWAGEFLGLLDSHDKIDALESEDPKVIEILSRKLNQSKEERSRPFNFKEFHERAGHQIGQMLLECKFIDDSCNASDFKTVSLHPCYMQHETNISCFE